MTPIPSILFLVLFISITNNVVSGKIEVFILTGVPYIQPFASLFLFSQLLFSL